MKLLTVFIAIALALLVVVGTASGKENSPQVVQVKTALKSLNLPEPSYYLESLFGDGAEADQLTTYTPAELTAGGVQTSFLIRVYPSETRLQPDFDKYYSDYLTGERYGKAGEPFTIGSGIKAVAYSEYGDANPFNDINLPPDGVVYPTGEAKGIFACGNVYVFVDERRAASTPCKGWNDNTNGPMSTVKEKLGDDALPSVKEWMQKVAQALQAQGACGGSSLSTGPTIILDRVEAPRGSAIKVTGKGFTPNTFVNILWNGAIVPEFRSPLPANQKGEIGSFWIWVKDDAKDDTNTVWAEDSGGRKSDKITVNVIPVKEDQLINNFNAIMEKYYREIKPNPNSKMKNGPLNNIAELFGINPVGYACGAYQQQVLLLLDSIRFAPKPEDRQIMDGFDYGPMYSGFTRSKIVGLVLHHAFVVMYPHGSDWKTSSVAVDPWREQHPTLYEFTSNSKDWTKGSIYSNMIKSKWNDELFYAGLDPFPQLIGFTGDRGKFPITGGTYYDFERVRIAEDYANQIDKANEPPKGIVVHCQVQLEVRDAEGHKLITTADGQVKNEIPGGYIVAIPDDRGGYEWYGALPEGNLQVIITGTGSGSFTLLTKNANQPIYEYPSVALSQGQSATIMLDDQSTPHPLRTPDGKDLYPTGKGASVPSDQNQIPNLNPPGQGCREGVTSLYADYRALNPGQDVVIPIVLCNSNDITNMDLGITYDTKVLGFKNAVKGSLNAFMLFDSNNVGNTVKIAFAHKLGMHGTGSIAVLTFTVIGKEGSSSPININVNEAGTSSGAPVNIPVQNGQVKVGNPNPNNPSGNPNGKPNQLDAMIALHMSVGKQTVDLNYDLTKDGKVTSGDARTILQLAEMR